MHQIQVDSSAAINFSVFQDIFLAATANVPIRLDVFVMAVVFDIASPFYRADKWRRAPS